MPLFLADPTALMLLSQDALVQRDRLVLEPHCSFLCNGRPITSFALHANLWKYDVSLWRVGDLQRSTVWLNVHKHFGVRLVSCNMFSLLLQPGFLLAVEQKGFELLELRGEDPRLASLDTLSGEEIPLHLLLRLHGYIIQVGGCTLSSIQREAHLDTSVSLGKKRWV